jgi:hypothetical protein
MYSYMNEELENGRKEYHKKYREENRERRTAYQYAWKEKNPEQWKALQRKAALKRKFGISLDEYNKTLESQGNRCKICQLSKDESKVNFAVDHDHKTGRVRGVLCRDCNMGLGKFKDDSTLLSRALAYLNDEHATVKQTVL